MRLTVPLVHAGNRGSAIAWGYAGFCLLYLGIGHLGSRDPTLLTPSILDRAVAFVPWTVWLYLGQFPDTFSALWWAADDETLAGPPGQAYRLVYGADVPTNWFPSLHVALAALAAAGLAAHGRWTGIGAVVGALLTAASTLTTKQHYVVDAVGGLVVAAAAWCVAGRWLRYGQRTVPGTPRLRSVPR